MTRTGVLTRFVLLVLAGLAVVGGPATDDAPTRPPTVPVTLTPAPGR